MYFAIEHDLMTVPIDRSVSISCPCTHMYVYNIPVREAGAVLLLTSDGHWSEE